MSIITKAAAAAKRVGAWALRRARERSTWAGLAIVAGALGKPELAGQLTGLGNAASLILGVAGGAIAAATTSQHPSVDQA